MLSFPPSCYSSYGAWTLTPVGLAPTDHASLRWTHRSRYLSDKTSQFARTGNTRQSQKLVEKLSQLFPNDFMIQAFNLPATRAAIRLSENDPAAAIEILRPVTPYDLAISDSFYNVYPAYLRGLAYLQLKEASLAAVELRKVLDHPGLVDGFVIGALSVLQLARSQALMGDGKAAQKSNEDFLTLWKDADPDLPIYKTAKAEYADLRKTLVQ